MPVHPVNTDHHSQSKNEDALVAMNDHIEHAAVPLENANEEGVSTTLNRDPNHPVNWPLYKVEFVI